MIEFISQPWHWAVSGVMITFTMFLLIYMGQKFGVSSSFRALCSAVGGGKTCTYLDYNWKSHGWLLWFVAGSILGGAIAVDYFASPLPVQISQATLNDLSSLGVDAPAAALLPTDVFNFENLKTGQGLILMVLGGFLIGFGTRWAGGCTSGHAISGLSNLQVVSLVAVIGFFVGGLLFTHLLMPLVF